MWNYTATTIWKEGKLAVLGADGKPDLSVATPPDFGGPDGQWTPEDLLSASVGSCLLFSALYFIERKRIKLDSLEISARVRMEKTATGLGITGVSVNVQAIVQDEAGREGMAEVIELAEESCPVSRALACPVRVALECSVAGG